MAVTHPSKNPEKFFTLAEAVELANHADETSKLCEAVNDFAHVMKVKLLRKMLQGQRGWDEPLNLENIEDGLRKHVTKSDPIDVANFAMMLWYIRTVVIPAEQKKALSDSDKKIC
jgi:hypothetical protein